MSGDSDLIVLRCLSGVLLSAAAALLIVRYSVRQLPALQGSTTRTRCAGVSDPCVCTTVSFGLVLKGRLLLLLQLGSGVRLVRGWCTSKSAAKSVTVGGAGCADTLSGELLGWMLVGPGARTNLTTAPTVTSFFHAEQLLLHPQTRSCWGSHQRQQSLTPYKAPRCSSLVRGPRSAAAGGPSDPAQRTHIVPQGRKGLDADAAGPHRVP